MFQAGFRGVRQAPAGSGSVGTNEAASSMVNPGMIRVGTDTIYALSSGGLPSGVAVVRVSGPGVRFALETIAGFVPEPRRVRLATLRDPTDGEPIDTGLVLFFPGPASFTGEDVAEFQVHGGRAVVAALLTALGKLDGFRLADAGEFTRRAFEAGRIDLTAAEGLADLIAAETGAQRRQALAAARGGLSVRAEAWRADLVRARAAVEADLDFSDEDDVPESLVDEARTIAAGIATEIAGVLADAGRGERVRDGFEVVILGPPNAGKSSLANAIARRDVAIVTSIPGTTRDLLEVHLDIGGAAVTLVDTAGLRQAGDVIEAEGIRRGRERAAGADLILWLDEFGSEADADIVALGVPVLPVRTKADLAGDDSDSHPERMSVSVGDRTSLLALVEEIGRRAGDIAGREPALVTRARQRLCLEAAVAALQRASDPHLAGEFVAEALREASHAMGRLAGRIDVEEVLGSIFSSFCIGK
jgi:tRNA modification GTPase